MRLGRIFARGVAFAWLGALAALSAGCGGGGTPVTPGALGQATQPIAQILPNRVKKTTSPFQHIVIIVQENESFDHFFYGYPGADTSTTCKIHTGQTIPLVKQALGVSTGTSHYSVDFLADLDNGKMDGFDIGVNAKPTLGACTYVDPTQLVPYYTMGNQYVLADKFFTSHIDASFVAHQYIIAAQAGKSVNLPTGNWGCDSSGPDLIPTLNANRTVGPLEPVCMTYKTLADELDGAGLTWHYYAPFLSCPPSQPSCDTSGNVWSAYQAVSQIYNGPDWQKDVISPETQILTDIPKGVLSNVTWVTPDNCNSDHPGSLNANANPPCANPAGPQWVASIVNAIGKSKFWNTTEIFVFWDEWGGEYDHVMPPKLDYDGDGFRVGMLCISPYAYSGQVNHTQLEVTSIVKAVETDLGLATLAAADKRATTAESGCVNPSQSTPRKFVPIPSSLDANYFIHEKHSKLPPDDS
jgi:phospholipase C